MMVRLFRHALVTGRLVAAAALAVQPVTGAQQQSSTRAGWPCGGRVDPAYFQGAEGTGGQLLLLAPEELGESAALLTAPADHPQTIFRLAGAMNPGVHEFRVPIDSSVESVVFSISVQCLQTADVARPSGAPLAGGDGVTDLSNFRAVRMLIVKRPEPGVWTLRVAGSGIAGVMVKARSALGIADVQFAAAGSTVFTRSPLAGVENSVRITITGRATEVEASLVDGAFRRIAPLPLTVDALAGSYVSSFTPGVQGFRLMIEGKDADGIPFQRVQAPLLTAAR
jgi:von Willebrand factor A domain-containing protein 7